MCFIVNHLSWSNGGHCCNIYLRMQFALIIWYDMTGRWKSMEIPPISVMFLLFNSAIPFKSCITILRYKRWHWPSSSGGQPTPPNFRHTWQLAPVALTALMCQAPQPTKWKIRAFKGHPFEQRYVYMQPNRTNMSIPSLTCVFLPLAE